LVGFQSPAGNRGPAAAGRIPFLIPSPIWQLNGIV